ncbi:MAG: twin-arginine translocase subunit TatB [Cellvibrionales bacterium]|nr:twin-arginine translocase subunit TatB [Cellvibrionales bacterium]
MFGIGFFELLLIALIGLLVFGPQKLPEAVRSCALVFGRCKRFWQAARRELENELGFNEIRREVQNTLIMEELEKRGDGPDSDKRDEKIPITPANQIK